MHYTIVNYEGERLEKRGSCIGGEAGGVQYWIEAHEEDAVRRDDPGFGEFLVEGYARPWRNLRRFFRGERRPFTFEKFLDEIARLKLVESEWEPVDYAVALEPHVGLHVELEDTSEEVELDSALSLFEQSKCRSLATLSYSPQRDAAVIRAPAVLKESVESRHYFAHRVMEVIKERRLYQIYKLEYLMALQDRAFEYPYLYNKALFEQLSHVASGHPIPVDGSEGEWFWPPDRAATLSPLKDLPESELEAINIREAKIRAEWLCFMSQFQRLVFTNSLFH